MSGFQIARIRGIPIRIHVSFLFVLPLLAMLFGRNFAAAARIAELPPDAIGGPRWAWGLGLAVALFASVLVHELAHSLYAIHKGGKVRGITLLMIGGVSEISEPLRKPGEEAMMAFVGPLTSLALGAALFGLYAGAEGYLGFGALFAVFYLAQLNVILGIFNLLPAFPMDGGRILRGLLARKRGLARATRIAAGVGKGFAVLFGILGLASFNLLLIVIAFFVYMGADAEARQVAAQSALGDLRVRDVMSDRAGWVSPEDSLDAVVQQMMRERRTAYPVAESGEIVGAISLGAVKAIPAARREALRVREAMRPPLVAAAEDRVVDALRLFTGPDAQIAVLQDGRLVGTLTREDVERVLALRELEGTRRPRGGGWSAREREAHV